MFDQNIRLTIYRIEYFTAAKTLDQSLSAREKKVKLRS